MSDLALIVWGAVAGSWVTSLWIMCRKAKRDPATDYDAAMWKSMAWIRDAQRFVGTDGFVPQSTWTVKNDLGSFSVKVTPASDAPASPPAFMQERGE